jgi:stage V sporulation protein S
VSQDVEVTPQTNREPVIKVSARSDITPLAGTMANALLDSNSVKVRAIGAAAVNQAVKAAAKARGFVAQRGQDMVVRPGFETTHDISRPGTSGSNELSCIVLYLSVE